MSTTNPPLHVPRVYQTGTLTYTRNGLFVLSLWLLWGDFALYFFESVLGRFLPIYLKDYEASNTVIGLMTGSFAGLVNVVFLPGFSRWSDNFRGRLGRRIPFLYIITPLLASTLVLLGLAPEIGGWIYAHVGADMPSWVSRSGFVLSMLGLLMVSFHFFNMLMINTYNWLIRDVVPLPVMARFLAWFRIVSTVSSVFFLWFVFPHLEAHRGIICAGVGGFYLVAFWLMCNRVKEGTYPPPIIEAKPPGVVKTFAIYFRECLQIPLYRNFFIVNLLVISAINCATNFTTLFVKESLGMDMGHMGHLFSWTAAASAAAFFPVGWLCDQISPMKVALGSLITLCLGSLWAYFAIRSPNGFLIYSVLFTVPLAAWTLGCTATGMMLFPSEKFGQFSGGLNVFGTGGLIIGNIVIGWLMDWLHNDYRTAFLWTVVLAAVAIVPMLLVIRGWRQHGGPDTYMAPLPK